MGAQASLPLGPGAAVCSVSRQPLKEQGCSAEPSLVPGVALLFLCVPLCIPFGRVYPAQCEYSGMVPGIKNSACYQSRYSMPDAGRAVGCSLANHAISDRTP